SKPAAFKSAMSSRIFLGTAIPFKNQADSFYPPPESDSSHPGAAVVHDRRAFGHRFFPCCQPHSIRWNVKSGFAGRKNKRENKSILDFGFVPPTNVKP
ncbi:MAG: hypothetical protein KDA87_17770, partial [Planctomycetales bacterium]|nr:hypothetical protein [Planctomycetales bacterium]